MKSSRRTAVLLVGLVLISIFALHGEQRAGVVRQITDFETYRFTKGGLSASGAVLVSDRNADLGDNPEHVRRVLLWDLVTASPSVLADYPRGARAGSISDDGQTIVFSSFDDPLGTNADGSWELFAISADGQSLVQLTDDPVPGEAALKGSTLAGDGSRVVFVGTTDPFGTNPLQVNQLFSVLIDGTQLTQLTQLPLGEFYGLDVSDDGQRVVFSHLEQLSGGVDRYRVYSMDGDGSNLTVRYETVDDVAYGTLISGNGQLAVFELEITLPALTREIHGFLLDFAIPPSKMADGSYATLTDDGQNLYYLADDADNTEIFNVQPLQSLRIRNTKRRFEVVGSTRPLAAGNMMLCQLGPTSKPAFAAPRVKRQG